MGLSRRELFLVYFYFIIIAIIAVYFVFLKISYPRYTEVNQKIKGLENMLMKINAVMNSRNLVDKEYDVLRKKFASAGNEKAASTDILQDIKSKAGDSGLNVINIKPLSLKDDELYNEFDFKLETEGELSNFGNFLYNLDNSPYIFKIKYTQINAQGIGEPLKIQLLLGASLSGG